MLPSFLRCWDQWWLLSFAKPTWVNMCMINGAIIVHRETINVMLHAVGCPLTRPTSNASQKSCSSVCPGFRWGTKENIVIIYWGTNLKLVFFFLSFFTSSQKAMSCALNRGVRQLSSSVPLMSHAPCSDASGEVPCSILLARYSFLIYIVWIQLASCRIHMWTHVWINFFVVSNGAIFQAVSADTT